MNKLINIVQMSMKTLHSLHSSSPLLPSAEAILYSRAPHSLTYPLEAEASRYPRLGYSNVKNINTCHVCVSWIQEPYILDTGSEEVCHWAMPETSLSDRSLITLEGSSRTTD